MHRKLTLEETVGPQVFQEAGLGKLSPEEQRVLAAWIRDYTKQLSTYLQALAGRRKTSPGKTIPRPEPGEDP